MSMKRHNQSDFWSVRKLLLTYHCLSCSPAEPFLLSDIIYPFLFPRSLTSNDWEAFRTFRCLSGLTDTGISISSVRIDPLAITLDHINESILDRPLKKEEALSILEHPNLLPSTDGGEEILVRPDTELASLLTLPGFFWITLKLNPKRIKKSLKQFCQAYRQGTLTHSKPIFSYTFMNRLLKKVINVLSFRQGKRFLLGTETCQEFFQIFKEDFPGEYRVWKQGEYTLPLYTHLIALDQFDLISLEGFHCSPKTSDLDHKAIAFHKVPFAMNIGITLNFPKPKRQLSFGSQRIHVIEVVPDDNHEYLVYVNRDYRKPITLNRKQKTGSLIYTLAEEGYAEWQPYCRVFEYVNSDPRFRLFAKKRFKVSPLLQRNEEGHIVPAEGITLRFHHS